MHIFSRKQPSIQQAVSAKSVVPDRTLSEAGRKVNLFPDLHSSINDDAAEQWLQDDKQEFKDESPFSTLPRVSHNFSRIPVRSGARTSLQAKLRVDVPGDISEREADQVAQQVMRMSEPQLQRACDCGGGCPNCQNEKAAHGHLQTKRVHGNDNGEIEAPSIVHEVLRSPGHPLDTSTQKFMESRFGHDFSQVRVHTDGKAAESAHALGARAYTVGSEIVFGAGEYAPNITEGRVLLAHEFTHVVQQTGMAQKKIQRQSIHNPLYPCMETDYLPGNMDIFGTLVHLAIEQHYVKEIDAGAGTEYAIPGSGKSGFKDGRADIVSSKGGVYEIKPVGNTEKAFKEAENYVSQAEKYCDPHINWHLGTVYYPPKTPMIINNTLVNSWLYAPGVIAYYKKNNVPQQLPIKELENQPKRQDEKQRDPKRKLIERPEKQPDLAPGLTPLPGVPLSAPELLLIIKLLKDVIERKIDLEQAAEELFRNNPKMVWAVLILGTIGIIALVVDDASLVGVADDILIPPIEGLMGVAWRFAF